MKIVIPAQAKNIDSILDLKFGKCKYFCVYDPKNDQSEFFKNNLPPNQGKRSKHILGLLKKWETEMIITANIGPNMINSLEKEGIRIIVLNNGHQKIRDVLAKFRS